MRKPVDDLESLVGLTIQGVSEVDDNLVLTFTDGTYAAFASQGDHDCRCAPELIELKADPYGYLTSEYMASGVWNADDYTRWTQQKEAAEQRSRAAAEAAERAQYEKLKAKFG